MTSADLAAWSVDWSRQWWDPDAHLVHNSAGSFGDLIPERTVHLTPQSAWVAYGLLGSSDPADRAEADAAVGALLGLQYDAPDSAFHGTFAKFPEAPFPPDEPVMWEDYDPNWRQFVGTAFALMLEDFGDVLSDERRAAMMAAIALACAGEEAEGRLAPSYANPALMHSWLDAWCGRRVGDATQVERAERFAARIVKRFDRFGAFDEFNSPTYYGIDLYALALWRTFPPTEQFARDGARLEAAIWQEAAGFYHAGLANFCGPYTRSYGPDATRTVTLVALWIWAIFGRDAAPLPDLDAHHIDHGHDLMAGPVIARLAQEPSDETVRAAFAGFRGPREIHQELPTGRVVSASLYDDLILGAEASEHDWGGWDQFMPATAHWREPDGVGVAWLVDPRKVSASVDARRLVLEVQRPGVAVAVELLVAASSCVADEHQIRTARAQIGVVGEGLVVRTEQLSDRLFRVSITPVDADVAVLACVLSFTILEPVAPE